MRSEEALPEGNFDPAHYRQMHHHLFQDAVERDRKREAGNETIGVAAGRGQYLEIIESKVVPDTIDENGMVSASASMS